MIGDKGLNLRDMSDADRRGALEFRRVGDENYMPRELEGITSQEAHEAGETVVQ